MLLIGRRQLWIGVTAFLCCCSATHRLEGLDGDLPPSDFQVSAVEGLIVRLLGEANLAAFDLHIKSLAPENRYFELQAVSDPRSSLRAGKQVVVRLLGDSGVSLATGLYAYLKEDMQFIVTWGEDGSGDNLPPKEAWYQHWRAPVQRKVVSNSQVQYYENVCTFGYSQTWWDWDRWEREIDWMALHGINLPLAFVGQEKVLLELFTTVGGLESEDVLSWMSGPAFLPWFRMGNIQKFAGLLPTRWIEGQHQLQLRVLQRMRSLGMIPVLPAFAGHLPDAFGTKHPSANITLSSSWNGFAAVHLLEAVDPLFKQLGSALIDIQHNLYDFMPKVFNADMYNEMDPRSGDLSYLKSAGAAPYEGIRAANPEGILMIQGWLFFNSKAFWTEPRIEAYLSGVPSKNMIILDLYSEVHPQWQRTQSYFGRPWIWNVLLNFGGNRGLYGNINDIGSLPLLAIRQENSTCIGTGITPEAIENNPVIFEVITEVSWQTKPIQGEDWLLKYAERRYASTNMEFAQAWQKLHAAVYNTSLISKSIVRLYPRIDMTPSTTSNVTLLTEAARQLTAAAAVATGNGPLQYDVVDVIRQVLDYHFFDLYKMYRSTFDNQDLLATEKVIFLQSIGAVMLRLIEDQDSLLATDANYLLGRWLAKAEAWSNGSTPQVQQFLFNAINQVTRWGTSPHGQINDYASKAWAGLTSDYYLKRWARLLRFAEEAAKSGKAFDQDLYSQEQDAFQVNYNENVFNKTCRYSTEPTGETSQEAARLLQEYADADLDDNFKRLPGQDSPGNDVIQAETRDARQLAALCLTHPGCVAFNTNGYIKLKSSPQGAGKGVTLYVRQDLAPEGAKIARQVRTSKKDNAIPSSPKREFFHAVV